MSSNLPLAAQQAGNLLKNPLALQGATYRQMIIDWGREQIALEYPKDPPHLIRRQLALMEWDRVVRTNGQELRGLVAGAAVRELHDQLQRREPGRHAQGLQS